MPRHQEGAAEACFKNNFHFTSYFPYLRKNREAVSCGSGHQDFTWRQQERGLPSTAITGKTLSLAAS